MCYLNHQQHIINTKRVWRLYNKRILTLIFLMNVMNLLLNSWRKKIPHLIGVYFSACEQHKMWHAYEVPLQDAHGRFSVFNQAQSAVTISLVLDRHAAYLHHHLPQFFGCAATLLRTWELFASWGQELTELWDGKKMRETDKEKLFNSIH